MRYLSMHLQALNEDDLVSAVEVDAEGRGLLPNLVNVFSKDVINPTALHGDRWSPPF